MLYNNPNNGNFSLKGNILEKETCTIKLYDMTGKFIHSQTLEKNKSQNIYLKEKLIRGTYMVQVNDSKNNNLANIKMIVKN
ncbi:T9SS type A sorting domain-containing protein [Chryseobacterium scophthalmum]|uniref:T9SS type A sorting domain-containing protein n=1 Tax=Chryseobacterium scophthalmum TaxID=59733 RepID=UPI0035E7B63A